MNAQALKIAVAGGLLISSALAAQPLRDLQDRLAAVRNVQPIRVKVDVELQHRGKAPLHLNDEKQKGRVIIEAGPRGVKVWEQKRTGSTSHFSLWNSEEKTVPTPLVEEADAFALIDPAGWLGPFLIESTLVDDQEATWEGTPARLLVVRPSHLPAELEVGKASTQGEPKPVILEAKIWLGEDGLPLALERTAELRLPALTTTQHQTLTFQLVGGRLLVRRSTETFSGTALAALHGSDTKKMKVTVD
jgi:hypothetical protein